MAKKHKKVADEVLDVANTIWLAGLGALATTQEEGGKLFKKLVKKGEGVESFGEGELAEKIERAKDQVQGKVDKAKDAVEGAWGDLATAVDEQVAKALHKIGVPTRDEIKTLTERVAALTRKVDQLRPKAAAAPKAAAPKAAAPKEPAKPKVAPKVAPKATAKPAAAAAPVTDDAAKA